MSATIHRKRLQKRIVPSVVGRYSYELGHNSIEMAPNKIHILGQLDPGSTLKVSRSLNAIELKFFSTSSKFWTGALSCPNVIFLETFTQHVVLQHSYILIVLEYHV